MTTYEKKIYKVFETTKAFKNGKVNMATYFKSLDSIRNYPNDDVKYFFEEWVEDKEAFERAYEAEKGLGRFKNPVEYSFSALLKAV